MMRLKCGFNLIDACILCDGCYTCSYQLPDVVRSQEWRDVHYEVQPVSLRGHILLQWCYKIHGSVTRQCQATGRWNGSIPGCFGWSLSKGGGGGGKRNWFGPADQTWCHITFVGYCSSASCVCSCAHVREVCLCVCVWCV